MTDDTDRTVTVPAHQLAQMQHDLEQLQEAAADATRTLRADELGWSSLASADGSPVDRERVMDAAAMARVMAVADPLIRRATVLRIAYVWGSGVTITAAQEDDAEQDVNAVVQAFLDDQAATFHGSEAREQRERTFATDGTVVYALPTDPATGRVQVRRIPVSEIKSVVTNPDDREDPWLYRRAAKRRRTLLTRDPRTGDVAGRENIVDEIVYYPALGNTWSRFKPTTYDGHRIEWDTPVLLAKVNPVEDFDFGTPDLMAALPWARGYKGFLEDWAKLVKALSKFAFQATAKGSKAGQTRAALAPAMTADAPVGQTLITSEGQRLEAIGKSGATIDSESGRPLAAMVASATDLPVTMLLADPGVTGARATAETLDRPLEEVLGMRRRLHEAIDKRVLDWVIQSAIKAPRGALKGTQTVDPVTGREEWILAGGQPRDVSVDFPPLAEIDMKTLVDAVKTADGTGKLPPLQTMALLLRALEVDGAAEIIEKWTDEDGDWIDPADQAAAKSQVDAVRSGRMPGRPAVPDDDAAQPDPGQE